MRVQSHPTRTERAPSTVDGRVSAQSSFLTSGASKVAIEFLRVLTSIVRSLLVTSHDGSVIPTVRRVSKSSLSPIKAVTPTAALVGAWRA
jgi:hypothetical protein